MTTPTTQNANSMNRPAGQMTLSILLIGVAILTLAFLLYWYWEVILWIILLPFQIFSLNLGVRLLNISAASLRALIYWVLSVIWMLGAVIYWFNDTTVIGLLISASIAASVAMIARHYIKTDTTSA